MWGRVCHLCVLTDFDNCSHIKAIRNRCFLLICSRVYIIFSPQVIDWLLSLRGDPRLKTANVHYMLIQGKYPLRPHAGMQQKHKTIKLINIWLDAIDHLTD